MPSSTADTARGTRTNPEPIVQVATGFMAAKQLFVANEIGLFAALGDGGLTASELASRCELPERTARIVADAMVGLGLVTRDGDRYVNGEAAAAYLAGDDGTLDLRPFLTFWNEISYPHWLSYADSVRSGKHAELDITGPRQPVFFGGVQAYNSAHALMLAEHYDFMAHKRILDLAGLSSAFLLTAMEDNPELQGTFFAEPMMVQFAQSGLPEGEGDRIEFIGANVLEDELPTGFDVVLLEHVVHRYGPEDNKRLLARARAAAEPGAKLLVLDFYLTDEGTDRVLDALLAGEYHVIDETIVYPEAEVRGWVQETGWRFVETRLLPGSPRVLIAEAV